MSATDGWQRMHPLSPIVRGGRATIAVAVLLLPTVLRGGDLSGSYVQLAIVGVLTALGFVSWLVTRWRIDGDDLQIETGLLRRQSLRFPLSQVQAVDIVRPGLARIFRVAELRLRMGGASGSTARLAYLPEREVEPLRVRLLALAARRASATRTRSTADAVVEERVLTTVPTGRLVASILISDVGLVAEAVVAGLIVTALLAPAAATGVVSGGAVWIVSVAHPRLAALQPGVPADGRGGPGRPARPLRPRRAHRGDDPAGPRAGRAHGRAAALAPARLVPARGRPGGAAAREGRGRGAAQGAARRAPGRQPALAEELLDRIVPDRPREQSRPPRRARWKSPLRYRMIAWGTDGDVRRDDERPAPARHLLGSAAEGAEPAPGAGPGAAPAAPRERARRHGGPERPRDAARPGRRRGRPGARAAHRSRPGGPPRPLRFSGRGDRPMRRRWRRRRSARGPGRRSRASGARASG